MKSRKSLNDLLIYCTNQITFPCVQCPTFSTSTNLSLLLPASLLNILFFIFCGSSSSLLSFPPPPSQLSSKLNIQTCQTAVSLLLHHSHHPQSPSPPSSSLSVWISLYRSDISVLDFSLKEAWHRCKEQMGLVKSWPLSTFFMLCNLWQHTMAGEAESPPAPFCAQISGLILDV